MIEGACEFVLDRHLASVLTLKAERYGKLEALPRGAFALPGQTSYRPMSPAPKLRRLRETKIAGRMVKRVIAYE